MPVFVYSTLCQPMRHGRVNLRNESTAAPERPTQPRLCSGVPDSLKTRGRTLRATVGGALTARHRLADVRARMSPTPGAEGLVSGGKPTVFQRVPKVGS